MQAALHKARLGNAQGSVELGKSITPHLGCDGVSGAATAHVGAFSRNRAYPRKHLYDRKIIIVWLKSTLWSKSVLQTADLKCNKQMLGKMTPEIYIQMSKDN